MEYSVNKTAACPVTDVASILTHCFSSFLLKKLHERTRHCSYLSTWLYANMTDRKIPSVVSVYSKTTWKYEKEVRLSYSANKFRQLFHCLVFQTVSGSVCVRMLRHTSSPLTYENTEPEYPEQELFRYVKDNRKGGKHEYSNLFFVVTIKLNIT